MWPLPPTTFQACTTTPSFPCIVLRVHITILIGFVPSCLSLSMAFRAEVSFWLNESYVYAKIKFFTCFVFPAAGWSQPKCWKNNLGRCRIRCLDDERYILLCRNKASCCIPRALMKEKHPHPRPQPSLTFPENVTLPKSFSVSPNTEFDDDVNFKKNESKGTMGNPPITPMKPTYPKTIVAVSTDTAATAKADSSSFVPSAATNTPYALDLDHPLSVSDTTLQ